MAKIATEGGGWRGAAERWLQGLGYPAACIETPMSGFVDEWWPTAGAWPRWRASDLNRAGRPPPDRRPMS